MQDLNQDLVAEIQPREGFSVAQLIPHYETFDKPIGLMSKYKINGSGEQNVLCKCHACGCWPFLRQRRVNNTSFEKYSLHIFKSCSITAPKGAIKPKQESES